MGRLSFVLFLSSILLLACGGAKQVDPPSVSTKVQTDQGKENAPAETPEAEVDSWERGEGDPANHYLKEDVVFVKNRAYNVGNHTMSTALEIAPPDEEGIATFRLIGRKRLLDTTKTKHFWHTRPAVESDLKVGTIALVFVKGYGQKFGLRPPKSVDEVYGPTVWWQARITSVAPLEDEGYVWVAEGYKAALGSIRIAEEDKSPRVTLTGEEDAHFIRTDHWFTRYSPLSSTEKNWVYPCAQVEMIDEQEGGFIRINNGALFLTKTFWKSRIPQKKELKKGTAILVPDLKDGEIFRAPSTRKEALFTRWWFTKVKKKRKNTVIVETGEKVSIDAVRIVEE